MKIPKWYLYGALIALIFETFFSRLSVELWVGGCYLVLGAVMLIVPDIYKKIVK